MYLFVKWMPIIMLIGGTAGYLLSRKKSKRAKKVFILSGCFAPVIFALCLIDLFFILALVGDSTGTDLGFSDRFDLPLHNGYHWTGVDSPGCGVIYKFAGTDEGYLGSIPNNRETFSNVREMQEEGDWIAGYYDSNGNLSSSNESGPGWFLFNTRTHQRIDAKNEEELRVDAAANGIQLHLQSNRHFYINRYFTWLVVLKIVGLLLLPILGLFLLWRLVVKWLNDPLLPLQNLTSAPP